MSKISHLRKFAKRAATKIHSVEKKEAASISYVILGSQCWIITLICRNWQALLMRRRPYWIFKISFNWAMKSSKCIMSGVSEMIKPSWQKVVKFTCSCVSRRLRRLILCEGATAHLLLTQLVSGMSKMKKKRFRSTRTLLISRQSPWHLLKQICPICTNRSKKTNRYQSDQNPATNLYWRTNKIKIAAQRTWPRRTRSSPPRWPQWRTPVSLPSTNWSWFQWTRVPR